jgi:hypothetical protein
MKVIRPARRASSKALAIRFISQKSRNAFSVKNGWRENSAATIWLSLRHLSVSFGRGFEQKGPVSDGDPWPKATD